MAVEFTAFGSMNLESLLISEDTPTVVGWREHEQAIVYVYQGGKRTQLNTRHDLRNHSPAGPNWGYAGSGPAQLALGLSCLVLPDKQALAVYQHVKRRLVAAIKGNVWRITFDDLREAILDIMKTVKVPPLCDCNGELFCTVCDGPEGS